MPAASRNLRGSSYDRRQRRQWLVEQFGVPNRIGEKTRVCCHHCGCMMRAISASWQVDRYPICGHHGGRYVRGNIVVSCGPCNEKRCGNQHRECQAGPKMQIKWRVRA